MKEALVRNCADEEQVKEAKLREGLSKDKELSDIYAIMSSVPGRRYMFGLIEFCGVYKTSFTGDDRTFFLEGSRNVGLKVLSDIQESCAEFYTKMIEENNKGEKQNGRSNTKPRNT